MSERREFLKAAGTGLLILRPETAFGSQANSAIEVGVIGLGGPDEPGHLRTHTYRHPASH